MVVSFLVEETEVHLYLEKNTDLPQVTDKLEVVSSTHCHEWESQNSSVVMIDIDVNLTTI